MWTDPYTLTSGTAVRVNVAATPDAKPSYVDGIVDAVGTVAGGAIIIGWRWPVGGRDHHVLAPGTFVWVATV